MSLNKILKIIFILFIVHTNFSFAQQKGFTIKGRIIEEKDSSSIVGVSVLIQELRLGTTTDQNGKFTFSNIPKGNFTLVFSLVGHKSQRISLKIPSIESDNLVIKMQEVSINLEEIIVTGNPLQLTSKEIAQPVLSISSLGLDIKRDITLAGTLNFLPGISMQSNGVSSTRPVIRGFNNYRVLILEDGLRMGDLSSTSDDHSISSDVSNSEKIEVIRGPSSLVYGSNAIGGVVNVITDAIPSTIPTSLNGSVYSGYSSNNKNYFGSVHLNYGYDLLSFHLRGLKRTSQNFRDPFKEIPNSDLDNREFEVGFSLHPSWGSSGISYSNYKTNYGIPITEKDEEPIAIEMEKKQIKILSELPKFSSLFNSLSFKLSYQNYHHKEYLRDDPNSLHGSEFSLNTLNADLSFTHKSLFDGNEGSFGLWLLSQKYNVEGEEALTPNANNQNFAFYLLEKFKIYKLGLTLGGRLEKNLIKIPSATVSDSLLLGEDKNFISFSGSIGFTYQINNSLSSYLNIANAFRSPAIEELASFAIHEATQSFDIGNRKLVIENNLGLDLGLRLEDENYKLELGSYFNSIKNYIYRNPTNIFYQAIDSLPIYKRFNDSIGYPVFMYEQADALLFGFEAYGQVEITNNLTSSVVIDYVRGYKKDDLQNLPQIPPLRFSTEIKYSTDFYWTGIELNVVNEQNKVSNFEKCTKGYGKINFFLGGKFLTGNITHTLNLRIDNLFNKDYRDHISAKKDRLLMPGRNISLSYRLIF